MQTVVSNFKMTTRSIISILTITFFITASFAAHGQDQLGQNHTLKFDTSKTAIIEFNPKNEWLFDSSYKTAKLTQNELQIVEGILLNCIADYNNSLDKDHKLWSIDFRKNNYRKQLIVVINSKGEKQVWVNCFCSASGDKWKNKIYVVDDGGNCFFSFKINLATKKYYDLGVNGSA